MKKKIISLTVSVLALMLFLCSCISMRSADGSEPEVKNIPETRVEEIEHISYDTDSAESSVPDEEADREISLDTPPLKYEGVNISLLAVGDDLIHPNIYTDAYVRGNEEKRYDFLPMFSDVSDMISSADIAFVNQETGMAGEEYGISGYPCFNSPRELADDLVTVGFDIVNIANNHMLDMGSSGLESTIKYWNTKPVTLIGGYLDSDDYKDIRVTEEDGIIIAWLAYTYGTNGIVKSASSAAVIPYIDDELIVSDIKRAHEIADFVIVSIHWGDENTQTPNAEQRRLASLIAESGADLILGHHSHTLQPIEWIETERGKVLCTFSLGNFASGMSNPVNMVGGLLTLNIVSDGEGGLTVDNVLFTPTVFWFGKDWYGTHIYLLSDYTDELAYSHYHYSGGRLSVDGAKAYVTNAISEEFLPEYMK